MSDSISAIMGTTRTVRTLVDGSMVIQIEVDPRHARDAFMLLGTPGTPVALARITPEAATAESRRDQAPKGGAICKLAGMWCNDPEFHAFLTSTMKWAKSYSEPVTAEVAANIVRETCGVASRAELDHDDAAAQRFHDNFRIPFQRWNQGARG